jgi:hypothetical protein
LVDKNNDFDEPGPVWTAFWPQLKVVNDPLDLYHSINEKVAQVYDSIVLIFLVDPKDKF